MNTSELRSTELEMGDVTSNGRTVWVNHRGSCVARFCPISSEYASTKERPANARLKTLAETARLVAKSKDAPVSVGYAIARDVWGLWWVEKSLALTPTCQTFSHSEENIDTAWQTFLIEVERRVGIKIEPEHKPLYIGGGAP